MEKQILENYKDKPLFALTVEEFMQLQSNTEQAHKLPPEEYQSDIIGIEEAAKITGYKRSTIYAKTSDKTIPYHKRGNRVVFKRSELEAWMLENRQETMEERIDRLDQEFISKKRKA